MPRQRPLDLQPLDLQPLDLQPLDLQPLDTTPPPTPLSTQPTRTSVTSPPLTEQQKRERGFRTHIETPMIGVDPNFYETIRQNMVDKIAMSNWIPESMKPNIATLNQAIFEFPRALSEMLFSPESVVTPSLVRGRAPQAPPPRAQSLLPAGDITDPNIPRLSLNDPYLGGPAGGTGIVQRESLITPQESSRISGQNFIIDAEGNMIPRGASTQPSGTVLDTDLLRQREPFYTQHELQGGTSLEVPDPVRMALPPTAGDTRLGTAPVSSGPLPYPLNVVPEAVRPRSQQTVTRALTGDVPPPTVPREPLVPETKPPLNIKGEFTPTPDLRGGTAAIQPGETILPSASVKLRNKVVNQASENSGLAIPDDAIDKVPPEIKGPLAQTIAEEAVTDSIWKSTYTRLRRLSEPLYIKSNRAVHLERQYAAGWLPKFENAISKLTKIEKENFGAYVEGTLKSPSPNVDNAVTVWRIIENEMGNEAIRTKLPAFADVGGKAKMVPFQKNTEGYWPHIAKEPYHTVNMEQRLVDSGMSRQEAVRVVKHLEKTGEFKIGPQFQRKLNAEFPYKSDASAGGQHIRSMSRRLAQNVEFGPRDMMGKGAEGISDLIEASKNPAVTRELMELIIGRGEKPSSKWTNILDRSRSYATITKLKNFTIPNMILGQQSTAQFARRHPIEAVKEVSKLFSKRYRDNLKASGALQNFGHTLAEEMGTRWDWYKIGMVESFNRRIAAAVGRSVAREALADLKKNPMNREAMRELSELVLEPVENLIKQDALTELQLRMAAGRAAEITQSLNVPGNLPAWGSAPVRGPMSFVGQLMWQFKKTGYQATKMVFDTVDPRKIGPVAATRNLAIWGALSQVAGELTKDAKAGANSLWDPFNLPESFLEERGKRADWWMQGAGITPAMIEEASTATGVPPEVFAHLMENWTQAFFFGLPADIIQSSSRSPTGLLTGVMGAIPTDVAKLANFLTTFDFSGLGKQVLKEAPIPGATGLQEQLTGTDEEQGLLELVLPQPILDYFAGD